MKGEKKERIPKRNSFWEIRVVYAFPVAWPRKVNI